MEQKAAIRCLHLSKSYRHYRVFEDLTFEVAGGECFALFGPNGAGKTTLLKVLGTLHRPSSGRFEIMGLDGVAQRQAVRELILLIGHGSHLYGELTAVENLRFVLALRGQSPGDREIKLALDRAGIGAFSDYKTRYFSEGMKRRLAVAKAILTRPQVLLMDEPYASLDEQGAKAANFLIREALGRGAVVFMTAHDRVRAAEVASRAAILHRGELREISVQELVSSHELF